MYMIKISCPLLCFCSVTPFIILLYVNIMALLIEGGCFFDTFVVIYLINSPDDGASYAWQRSRASMVYSKRDL